MKKSKKLINRLILLSALIFSLNACAQDNKLVFLHTSDPHLVFNLDKCDPMFYDLRKGLLTNEDSLKLFFNTVPEKVNADAVIITGDMIDYYKAAVNDYDGTMIGNQVKLFNDSIYSRTTIPTYLTLGNHDITTYWVDNKDSSRQQTQAYADKARAEFIQNIACFDKGTYYKKEFKVGETKYHFFFLDNGNSIPSDWINKTQLAWLNAELDKIGNDPVVIFQHRYFSVGDINGDGIFFKENKPTDWPSKEQCADGFLKTLNDHNNIKAIILGHGHKNVWEGINFPNNHKIYQIMTGSVSTGINNWRLIELTEHAITISKAGVDEIEIEIK